MELLRMASGPNRAPTFKVAPVSKGTPITAKSISYTVWTCGKRMKVLTPQKRGEAWESAGLYFIILPPSRGQIIKPTFPRALWHDQSKFQHQHARHHQHTTFLRFLHSGWMDSTPWIALSTRVSVVLPFRGLPTIANRFISCWPFSVGFSSISIKRSIQGNRDAFKNFSDWRTSYPR